MSRERLPFAPLRRRVDPQSRMSLRELGQALGISKASARTYTSTGTIPWTSADQIAVNNGAHPAEVWDEWIQGAKI